LSLCWVRGGAAYRLAGCGRRLMPRCERGRPHCREPGAEHAGANSPAATSLALSTQGQAPLLSEAAAAQLPSKACPAAQAKALSQP